MLIKELINNIVIRDTNIDLRYGSDVAERARFYVNLN